MEEIRNNLNVLESKVNMMDSTYEKSINRFDITLEKLNTTIEKLNLTLAILQEKTEQNIKSIGKLETRLMDNDKDHNLNLPNLVKTNILAIIMFGYIILNHLGFIK